MFKRKSPVTCPNCGSGNVKRIRNIPYPDKIICFEIMCLDCGNRFYHYNIPIFTGESFTGFAKVTYYSGFSDKKFTLSPVIVDVFDIGGIYTARDTVIMEKSLENIWARKRDGKCDLSVAVSLIVGGKDYGVYDLLDRINVYFDGKLSSTVTFHEAKNLKQVSIPIIKAMKNKLFIVAPVVIGASAGHHTIALELINRSGRALCICEEEINVIPEWVFELTKGEERCLIIPVEIRPSKLLGYGVKGNVYLAYEELKETSPVSTESEEVGVSFSSVDIDLVKSGAGRYIVGEVKMVLKSLKSHHLKLIRITVDEEYSADVSFRQHAILLSKRLCVFRIPHLPALEISAGTHNFVITLFEEWEGKHQEVAKYAFELSCR